MSESTIVKKKIVVCHAADFDSYSAILKLNYIFDVRIVMFEELTAACNGKVE